MKKLTFILLASCVLAPCLQSFKVSKAVHTVAAKKHQLRDDSYNAYVTVGTNTFWLDTNLPGSINSALVIDASNVSHVATQVYGTTAYDSVNGFYRFTGRIYWINSNNVEVFTAFGGNHIYVELL